MNTLKEVAEQFPALFAPCWTTDLTCGSGWSTLAGDACNQLDALHHRDNPGLRVHHISRNFGGLRLWAEPATAEVRNIVDRAERLSRYSCEYCHRPGAFGEHRFGAWLTLCPDCADRELGPCERSAPMPSHVIPYDSGLVALIGDFHYDSHVRAGLDPIEAGGLAGLPWTRLDALIITGDLANSPYGNWGPALRQLSRWIDPSRIYLLPGNHDYYNFGIDGDGDLRRLAAAEGVHFLQKTELVHGASRFLCVTLWTDFDLLGDPETAMREAERRMRDYGQISMPDPKQATLLPEFQESRRRVSLTPEVVLQLHHNHRHWLEGRLATPFDGRTVVVTHHCPHPAATGPVDSLTPAFCSNLEDLILQFQPSNWFFGHTHRRLTAIVGQTKVINTSIGYAWESRLTGETPLSQLCLLEPRDE